MEAFTPHLLRLIKNVLFGRLTRLLESGALHRPRGGATHRGRRVAPASQIQKPVDPKARLFAHDVRIISRRNEADGLGGARVEIAGRVHALLDHVGSQGRLVVDHDVVRRLHGALEPGVRLQVEIKVQHRRHALVNHRAGTRVPVSVGEFGIGRVEARVVSLAADDDAQRRVIPRVLGVNAFESFEYLRQFLLDHFVVLTLFCWVS